MGDTSSDGVLRFSSRVSAELLLDAQAADEPRLLMEYLRERGFTPDYLRSKSYLSSGPTRNVVSVLPFGSEDMTSVASLSVQRDLDEEDGDPAGSATIVRLYGAATPIDFTILQVRDGQVLALGPAAVRSLQEGGVADVFGGFLAENKFVGPQRLARVVRGRGLAPIVLRDLTEDEVRLGFTSSEERDRIMVDADLYADVARLHSYMSQSAPKKSSGGCSYCTSTSCYACTSCSCLIFAGNVTLA
jgi:hypothetical protein